MSWEYVYKIGLLVMGGTFGFLFGSWSILIQVLLMFMLIDYLSGTVASYVEGGLNSKVGFKGILKKLTMLMVIAIANMLDQVFGTGSTIRDGAIFFYMGNELISLIENAGRMGVPLPPGITNAVEVLKGKGGKTAGVLDVKPSPDGTITTDIPPPSENNTEDMK